MMYILGFDYLVKQLAAEGYVAIAININVNYTFDFGESIWDSWAYSIFEKHLELLRAS